MESLANNWAWFFGAWAIVLIIASVNFVLFAVSDSFEYGKKFFVVTAITLSLLSISTLLMLLSGFVALVEYFKEIFL